MACMENCPIVHWECALWKPEIRSVALLFEQLNIKRPCAATYCCQQRLRAARCLCFWIYLSVSHQNWIPESTLCRDQLPVSPCYRYRLWPHRWAEDQPRVLERVKFLMSEILNNSRIPSIIIIHRYRSKNTCSYQNRVCPPTPEKKLPIWVYPAGLLSQA